MTTFSWKRKAGDKVSKTVSSEFFSEPDKDFSDHYKWVQSFKKKKSSLQENCQIKIEDHKSEGIRLAELQRFQEAVEEWDKALILAPSDHKILEMKAQALLQMSSPFYAVQAAEKSVKSDPRWWVAYQTLGRCQLGIGEIKMAKVSFSKAIHINPVEQELWDDDLQWSLKLLREKEERSKEADQKKETNDISKLEGSQEANISVPENESEILHFDMELPD